MQHVSISSTSALSLGAVAACWRARGGAGTSADGERRMKLADVLTVSREYASIKLNQAAIMSHGSHVAGGTDGGIERCWVEVLRFGETAGRPSAFLCVTRVSCYHACYHGCHAVRCGGTSRGRRLERCTCTHRIAELQAFNVHSRSTMRQGSS